MRRFVRLGTAMLVLWSLLLSGIPAFGAEGIPPTQVGPCFREDLSTGTTQPFTPDPFGSVDPDWWVTASTDPNLLLPAPVYSIKPVPSWFTTAGANYVDPYNTGFGQSPTGGYTGYDPAGDYTFATTFTVNGNLYNNAMLRINKYAADNKVVLFLDGNLTPLGPAAGFGLPNSIPEQGPLAAIPIGPGTHTLEAKVRNDGLWMGVLVDAQVTADCRPDLSIRKGALDHFVAGQNGSYTVVVTNVGLGPTVSQIIVTDTLPPGATFVAATGSGWTCSNSGGTVTCTHPGPLGVGQSLPAITITMVVPQGVDMVQNCAAVRTKEDVNQDNDRGCVENSVESGRPGAICGVKFHDLNGNGQQESNEPTLSNWVIQIRDAAGNLVATITTGRDGTYCFKGLIPGTYVISEIQQNGWNQTYPLSPGTYTVTIASGQVLQGFSFGNRAKKADPCCLTFRFPAGKRDQFQTSNGAEPVSPSPGLQQWLANQGAVAFSGFDGTKQDTWFAHTLVLPEGNCIESATLTIRARPLGGLANNDSVGLSFIGSSGSPVPATPNWGAHFGNFGANQLLPNPWTPGNYASGQTFSLNLGSLPFGGNLIPTLNSLRYLDVVIQDDTSIDYMVLTVKFCECAPHHDPAESPKDGDNNSQNP